MVYLDNILYVICCASSTIRLYNMDTYSPLDVVINVDGMRRPRDIVICHHDRQLYVADWYGQLATGTDTCIWRVSVDIHAYVKWLSTDSTIDTFKVCRLSLTSRHLLVTSSQPPGLRRYKTGNCKN